MKRLRKDNVLSFLKEMNKKEDVFCPQSVEGRDLILMPLGDGVYSGDIGKKAVSAKAILFPQTEKITSFKGETISKIFDLSKVLLFGVRPCEIKAIQFTDRFMTRDDFIDPHYLARRKKLTTIVVACHEPPSDTCFCVDAGGMPYLENGYDVQLFDAGDFYIAITDSENGEKIVENEYFEAGAEEDKKALGEIKKRAVSQKNNPGMKKAIEILKEDKLDEAFWEGLAERCINCGGCVYVCPTCTCFNVYDLPSQGGYIIRCRSWDACLHAGFTRETSGHNPRPTQGSRLARRHEHKLKYDIINFNESGCVGCGRCSDACPVGLGAIEIIGQINEQGKKDTHH